MATGDSPIDREVTDGQSPEQIPFAELSPHTALEKVQGWRATVENNDPATQLAAVDRLAAMLRLTSPEVTGSNDGIRRFGHEIGSTDQRVLGEVLEGVNFILTDGDTFDRKRPNAFGGSLQRVADVAAIKALRNMSISETADPAQNEDALELLVLAANPESEFGRRERAASAVHGALVSNVEQGHGISRAVDGLILLTQRRHQMDNREVIDALHTLKEVAEDFSNTEAGEKAREALIPHPTIKRVAR